LKTAKFGVVLMNVYVNIEGYDTKSNGKRGRSTLIRKPSGNILELHDLGCCLCRWGEAMSELRPHTGLLVIPQVIHEYGEPW
jgi:hypothetical protein